MNRFIILTLSAIMWSVTSIAQTSYDPESGVIMYSDADNTMAYEPMEAPSSQKKTSNGTSKAKSVDDNNYAHRTIKDLAIYPAFDKYKRHKNANLSVIEKPNKIFMTLNVNDSPEIIKEITKLVEEDKKKSSNVIVNYSENKDSFMINLPTEYGKVTIFYDVFLDKNNCSLVISGPTGPSED